MRWARHPRQLSRLASLLLVLPLVLIAWHHQATIAKAQARDELRSRSDALTTSDADDAGRNPLVISVTNQDVDDNCLAQRPPVRLTESRDEAGIVNAVVEAGNGPIARVDFGEMANASVSVDGGPTEQTRRFSFSPDGRRSTIQFTVTPLTPDLAASVPLTVIDACGAWETHAGEDSLS